jgi:Hemerythrin HHE cation binding domain
MRRLVRRKEPPVATREQVLAALGSDLDYESAARGLAIPAGSAYLTATGLPADGSDDLPEDVDQRAGVISPSTQHLVYGVALGPLSQPEVHEWLKVLVSTDDQMQHAAKVRDPTARSRPATDADTTDSAAIETVITRDHDRVSGLFTELRALPRASGDSSETHRSRRQSITELIVTTLSSHEASEAEIFWPAVRTALADGDALADEGLDQEQRRQGLLAELAKSSADGSSFDELCVTLETATRRHVAFEDQVLLRLRDALGEDERRSLGARMAGAEGAS